jgi:multidrug efflux system membrane fusion protein
MPDSSPSEPTSSRPIARRRRWLGSVVAVLALLALGALAYWLTHRPAPPTAGFAGGGGPPGGAPAARGGGGARAGPQSAVGIAAATTRDMPVILEALGTVTPLITVTVRPQVSGVITQVFFTEGQLVKKGQLLVEIDPRPFEIALQQAIGARLRDEAQLELARITLQRYQSLLQQDSIARQDVDTQAALVKQLEGTVTMDKANEASARLNVAYTHVLAPSAGRIGLRQVDAGNNISTSDANGVATLTQIAPIDVEFAVPQDRVPEIQARVAEGARLPVMALDRTRSKKLDEGLFSTLDNVVDVTTGTVKAKARFSNTGNVLFPNQFVNAQVLLRTIANAVVVPVTALRHGPNGDFVYVLQEDRTVRVRGVTRGVQSADLVAISSGLQPGERVVTEGGDRLKDGAPVQIAGERPPAGASAPGGGRRRSGEGAASGPAAAAASGAAPAGSGAWAGRRASAARAGGGG